MKCKKSYVGMKRVGVCLGIQGWKKGNTVRPMEYTISVLQGYFNE